MSTPEERKENDRKLDFIAAEAAGDNKEAEEYLHLLAGWARITDDIYDEFENVDRLHVMGAIEIAFIRLPANKFFRENYDILFSQHLALWNAWEASNVLYNGDELDRIYAHVLRDYLVEVLPIVANLTQGHSKMKEVNMMIRKLFKKPLED